MPTSGRNTAISNGCLIDHAEIQNSILLENAKVSCLDAPLQGSLIGRNVIVGNDGGRSRGYRLLIGDDSKVAIH
jgi:ADP-glucose pyrophosphorylase